MTEGLVPGDWRFQAKIFVSDDSSNRSSSVFSSCHCSGFVSFVVVFDFDVTFLLEFEKLLELVGESQLYRVCSCH